MRTATFANRGGALSTMAGFVLCHRRLVIGAWLLVLVAGGFASSRLADRLTVDFSLPGQPGYETAKRIEATYGTTAGFQPPTIVVVTAPRGQRIRAGGPATAALERLHHALPGSRVVGYANTGDRRFLTDDGRSTFALLLTPGTEGFGGDTVGPAARAALGSALPPGYRLGITGLTQLQSSGGGEGTGVLAETLIGGAGALAVLAFVFASLLALVPLAVAAVSILSTLLVVLGLTYVTDVSFIVQFLVALVGLGIAIDYSLLLVTRWREERARGRSNHEAVVRAVATAGHTVAVSGLTVAIGLVALIVLPVPGLRSVGVGGVLIPAVSVLVTLTLLPAILGGIGPRVDWPRLRHEERASAAWTRWSALVFRHRVTAAGLGIVVLALCILPAFGLKVGETSARALSHSGPAYETYHRLVRGGVPGGVLTPLEVLTRSDAAAGALRAVGGARGIPIATIPGGADGHRAGLTDIVAVPATETVNNETLTPVRNVQDAVAGMPGVIGVAGIGPVQQDYGHAVFGSFPLMFSLIALVTFLLLARAFRSLLLAAKAVVLNLVSLAATFGLLTWFWQEGHGSETLFNIPATGAITFWLPLMVFAFLFGLSMDYEVFILSRVREEYDESGSTEHAVTEGLGRTGRLVTSAALILFLAFASLASAPNTDIKVLATGLGAGILLDATIVRALLVPALVALLGRWNWWLPQPLEKALVVRRPGAGRYARSDAGDGAT